MRSPLYVILSFVLVGLMTASCDLANQANQLATLARCKYKLVSLTGLRLAGVSMDGKSLSNGLSLTETGTITFAYLSGQLPLTMNLNVDIKNDQTDSAALSQMDYILAVDNNPLTTGSFPKKFSVAPGTTGTLPIPISVDLKQVLTGQSQTSLVNLVLNLAGNSTNPTNVGLRIRPYFTVNGTTLQFPRYFTVTTQLGGDSL